MNEDALPFLQLLFEQDSPVVAAPQPAPLAPPPFLLANFKFASLHNGIIGSFYFSDAGGHQRIRLTHNNGPAIGHYRAGGEWYFPPVGISFPPVGATTDAVNTWIANGGTPFPSAPVAGNQVIEYAAGHTDSAGRHVSRGVVSIPVITQNDINVIYQLVNDGADNNELRKGIVNNQLSAVLMQPLTGVNQQS